MDKLEFIKAWAILTSRVSFGVELGPTQVQDGIKTYHKSDIGPFLTIKNLSSPVVFPMQYINSPTVIQFPCSKCPILGMLKSHIDCRYDQNRDYKGLGYPHLRNLFLGLS